MSEGTFKYTSDIFFLEDKLPFNKTRYLIGSQQKKSYISVNKNQYYILEKIYELTNAKNYTFSEIDDYLMNSLHKKINVLSLHENLSKKGLMENSVNLSANNEIDMISTSIFDFVIDEIPPRIVKIVKALSKLSIIFKLLSVASLVVILFNIDTLLQMKGNIFLYDNSSIKGFLISMLVSIIIITIHELAHVFAAINVGLRDLQFYMVLYAKFIPMYYTTYSKLMQLKYKNKIRVLSAGLKTNIFLLLFSLASICLIDMSQICFDIMVKFSVVNAYFIFLNCSPFISNDGYFILINTFGIDSLRLNLWRTIISVFKRQKVTKIKNKFVLTYMVISTAFLIGSFFSMFLWIKEVVIEIIKWVQTFI
ncbi:hypothetical protein [Vallitalea maricola]|uniref:Uncharacterized protein n=1 Tax=Vallitalea maricola TaxID=3074433 RepID=A0ACB5UJS9_9FIRM|nr:hypothetical protein AN2V17_20420 [Vallitalea sp. AN17-2]